MQIGLLDTASQDTINKMNKFGLDDWLSVYGIGNKLEHDYKDIQYRLSQPKSSIGDIINYCVYDSYSLHLLEKKKSIIGSKLALQ